MSDSNANTQGPEALSPATEQAVNEAMEDQFVSFLEDCVSGADSPRTGYYERKVLAAAGEIDLREPSDRLSLFEERVIGRHGRMVDDLDAEIGASTPRGCSPRT